ncbi:MAG: hypothetical protein EKK55_17430 [Rhodocyclaceae bacterium]|nr:MAG: hypothetical protein EKK55_17430 [Rhodocyclaceae bacterium]
MKKFLKTILSAFLVGVLSGGSHAALVDVPGSFGMNDIFGPLYNVNGNFSSSLIDAAAEKVSFQFRVPKSGTITKVGFRTGTVSVSDTLAVTLQTLNASNEPSGTMYGGSATGTVSGLSSNAGFTVTLGTPATATAGDAIAAVIGFNSFVAGSINISHVSASLGGGYPTVKHFTASWSLVNSYPIVWIGYSDGSFVKVAGTYPFSTITDTLFNSGSATDEYALKFSVPFNARLAGFSLVYSPGATSTHVFNLYDSGGSTLSTISASSASQPMARRLYSFYFSSPQSITKNTVYRLGIQPSNTTDITIEIFTVLSADIQGALDGGTNFVLSQRADAGAWTDTTTKRLGIELLFDQVDVTEASSGGGGSSFEPYPFRWR